MKPLLLCLLLTGCASTTYRDGQRTFHTSADVASLRIGADGSLTMTGVSHSVMQREIASTITARANGLSALLSAAAAAALFK